MLWLVVILAAAAAPDGPTIDPPGHAYAIPDHPDAENRPIVSSHTTDAGPDQSFLLVGERLGRELTAWGPDPDRSGGREIKPKVQLSADGWLVATLPERAYEGPIVVWAKNAAGYSDPVVLNAPQAWWCQPEKPAPGDRVRIFGQNLAQRPDFKRAFVCLSASGDSNNPPPHPLSRKRERGAMWLKVVRAAKCQLEVELPATLAPGQYELRVHAGGGGGFGWSELLALTVARAKPFPEGRAILKDGDVQQAVDQLASAGGGVVQLAEGVFDLKGTLVVPANVRIEGAGAKQTLLVAPSDPALRLTAVSSSAWNQGPSGVHTAGDRMGYRVDFPAEGDWAVWVRYATEMSPYKQPGVSQRMTLTVDGGQPVWLDDLSNTGSFNTFKWRRSATIHAAAGKREVLWHNVKGGGIHIDAFVFTRDPKYVPGENPWPSSGPTTVVVQGEDVTHFESKDGTLPGVDRPAVWLAGDRAGVANLSIRGNARTNIGLVVRSPKHPEWIEGCRVSGVTVSGCEGKQAENCGIRLFHADEATVTDNELWGRAPIMLSGVRRSRFAANRLVSQTLWGGNAEGYILGRNETVHQCIIEGNVCACPPGAEGGGPTGRRLLWLSTGRGSVDLNWIADNREDRARFAGVAGTDQNVGEMILFEACERIAYHGAPVSAAAASVTLPARLSPTPDERLGNVKREQLAHDAAGHETPFWPPDADAGGAEPIATEYFVTILRGRGQGQTRRVTTRKGETYQLDRPWRVIPDANALVLVHTAFYRNHIIGNRAVDGMTGVQLWISCIENIVSDNEIQRMRKAGFYLYGNCSTLASSMPCTWNRGIGPLYFNQIEGSRCDETSCGALVTSGEATGLPVEFPRCLGNVLRHNSLVRSRTDGMLVNASRPVDEQQPSPAILGTIAEFNIVRDAVTGYRVGRSAEATLLRRNHAYFWYPVNLQPGPYVGFQVDVEKATVATELNTVEGIHGVPSGETLLEQRGPRKPAAGK